MTSKTLIAETFSRQAETYHQKAELQRVVAERLFQHIQYREGGLPEGPLLEIGCGTGFLSEHLAQHFSRALTLTDIAPGMLERCRHTMEGSPADLQYEVLDGEALTAEKRYALIASSLTFQWFHEFEATVKRLLHALKPGGVLAFSTLLPTSFPEWKKVAEQLGLPQQGHSLPELSGLSDVFGKHQEKLIFAEEALEERYDSPLEFFGHLKQIGAAASDKPNPDIKGIAKEWQRQCPDGITVTYHVAYILI